MNMKILGIKKTCNVNVVGPGTYVGVQSGHTIAIPATPEATVEIGDLGFGYKYTGEVYEIDVDLGIRGTSKVTAVIDDEGNITVD